MQNGSKVNNQQQRPQPERTNVLPVRTIASDYAIGCNAAFVSMDLHFTSSVAVKHNKEQSRVWQRLAVSQTQVRNTAMSLRRSSICSVQLGLWLG